MSEFKFACPVCGQHITADASTSGGQIECPTCFQKIVVPQAPASVDTKFILSASQVAKPRPFSVEATAPAQVQRPSFVRRTAPVALGLLVVLGVAGAALYKFRDKIWHAPSPPTPPVAGLSSNSVWSLDLKDAAYPETMAAGKVHGREFTAERASLDGVALSLRQGKSGPSDLSITIILAGPPGEGFAGKTFEVTPDQPPPVPRIVLRWKDEQPKGAKQEIRAGYALKLAFDQPNQGHLSGKVYLCVPDEAKSYVAGTFNATIRKPKAPPPKRPKTKG